MKVLIYAGSEFMTGDDIAAALLRYSEALAEGREAATIEIPIVGADGGASTAAFLVGPASQIVSKDVDSDLEEPQDSEMVAFLDAQTRRLHPTASTDSEPPPQEIDWTYEN
jgi:hypothetical protein